MTPDINRILKRPEFYGCSIRGAEYGRANRTGDGIQSTRLYVQRLRMVDGAYDVSGVYWGSPNDLWCGFTADLTVMVFVRADDRGEARSKVLERLSDCQTAIPCTS